MKIKWYFLPNSQHIVSFLQCVVFRTLLWKKKPRKNIFDKTQVYLNFVKLNGGFPFNLSQNKYNALMLKEKLTLLWVFFWVNCQQMWPHYGYLMKIWTFLKKRWNGVKVGHPWIIPILTNMSHMWLVRCVKLTSVFSLPTLQTLSETYANIFKGLYISSTILVLFGKNYRMHWRI